MSLLESASAALYARAHRNHEALVQLSCSATRQRLVLLKDSLPPEELWQWQQQSVEPIGKDDTQVVIEHLFAGKQGQSNQLQSPEFSIVEDTIYRARLRFHSINYSQIDKPMMLHYYVIMEREKDGLWRYFNTAIEVVSLTHTKDIVVDKTDIVWFPSIAEASLAHQSKSSSIPSSNKYTQSYQFEENCDDDDDDDDDDYWSRYDHTTIGHSAAVKSVLSDSQEDDYWAQYDQLEAQTPPYQTMPNKTHPDPSLLPRVEQKYQFGSSSTSAFSDDDARVMILNNLQALKYVAEQYSIGEDEFIYLARSVWS
jgi:hypothetical protein